MKAKLQIITDNFFILQVLYIFEDIFLNIKYTGSEKNIAVSRYLFLVFE